MNSIYKVCGKIILMVVLFFGINYSNGQNSFPYELQLTPISIPNLPGLHSYAFGQHEGKWLVIGGRKDGIHARQPFNSFPSGSNNTDIYVIDVATQQFWSASVNVLPTGIKEQLQATNMNFYQDGNTLYIVGGYAFSASANNHVTFDKLTSVDVPNTINAIMASADINGFFKQIANPIFQNSGGQMGKIGSTFYLVGGQTFTGRYNPMNNPTFTQTYQSKIQKFTIDNDGTQLSFGNYEALSDAVHLRRRDYNLVPQVYPNGELGYMISSGVFQINADLPFLYPVDVKSSGYEPHTDFNQYLSNYHSGKIGLFNATDNAMHSLFFGGISQYYYNGTTLVQDNTVPFVKTISRVTRDSDGNLTEHNFPIEMPNLKGAGAELIPNLDLPHYSNEVIKLSEIVANEFVIGHIYGGILSPSTSPFTNNQTTTTSADPTIYEVKLVYNASLSFPTIDGSNPFSFSVFPNPTSSDTVQVKLNLPVMGAVDYFVTSLDGRLLDDGEIVQLNAGENMLDFELVSEGNKIVMLTFVFDNKFYSTQKIVRK